MGRPISLLNPITGAQAAIGDLLAVVDVSNAVDPNKRMTLEEYGKFLGNAGLAGGSGIDVRKYGAVFDGTLHPLSEFFSTLAAAKAKLGSFVKALTESIDRCATQAAVNAVAFIDSRGGCSPVILPPGIGIWDYPVTIGSHPVQVVGAGPRQTILAQVVINCPFFVSFPAATPLPVVVDVGCPTGEKGFRFDGTQAEGRLVLTDTSAAELVNYNAVTREAWVKVDVWGMTDFDFQTIFSRAGSADQFNSSPADREVSSEVSIYAESGVKKIQIAYVKGGSGDNGRFAVPGTTPVDGTWHHVAETRAGNTCKVWWDGQLAGTLTLANAANQTPKLWEQEMVGTGGLPYPNGFAIQKCVNGVVASYRLSNSVRYTNTFTPPTTPFALDGNTLCIFGDLSNVDGLLVPVRNSVQGITDGIVMWHEGNYSGDVNGAGFSGLGFYQGSFGVFIFGQHNAEIHYITSQFTTYPIWLDGHSFQNAIRDINLTSCRNGVTLSGTSFASLDNFQIGPVSGFAVVTSESQCRMQDGFVFSVGGGTLLARSSQVICRNVFQTDENASVFTTYGFYCAGCQTVDIQSCFVYAALNGTTPIKLSSCLSATIANNWFSSHDSTAEIVKVVEAGTFSGQRTFLNKFVAYGNTFTNAANLFSQVPFTLSPARFRALDEQVPVSVADNGTLATNVLTGAGKSAMLLAVDGTNTRSAYYVFDNTTLTLISGHSQFSTVQGTGGKVNVYASGGKITLENKTGGALLLAAHEK